MISWFLSMLAALGLIGSSPAAAPTNGPTKTAPTSSKSHTQPQPSCETGGDGQPGPTCH